MAGSGAVRTDEEHLAHLGYTMAAASRLMYSYARDDMIIGSSLLRRILPGRQIPPYAMLLATLVPAIIVGVSIEPRTTHHPSTTGGRS